MEEKEFNERREEIFSKAVKAGKRTYFFDVKSTKSGQYYLTITESKRRFNNEQGKFFYEKHKIFLFKEDFEKFIEGLDASIRFIKMGVTEPDEEPEETAAETTQETDGEDAPAENPDTGHTDITFEDLGKEE